MSTVKNEEPGSDGSSGSGSPPGPGSPGSTSLGDLSYSQQVAKQFSTYKQTSGQERVGEGSPIGNDNAIATHSPITIRPSEMKDEGKMFIGGLSWDTTDEGLRKHFSQFGKVDACTIMRDPEGRSRGFAFLTFEEPESVNAVLAREHTLDGKIIDPKRAIPREEHLRNTRYFVGGLSHTTTAESMREFFVAFGKVIDTTVMVDRETGRSKGFGFVTFEDSSNQERFVGKLGLILDDKEIEVKMAQPRSQRDQVRNITSRDNFDPERAAVVPPLMFNARQAGNPGASMMYQRMMNQMPIAGMGAGGMGMMNPLMMGMGMNMGSGMGMGVNNFGGMNMGGMGMNPMMAMNPMAMRMGMGGPATLGMMQPSIGGMAMGNMGMRMRPGMGMGMGNMMAMNAGRMPSMSSGLGPSRMSTRGQHSFHPYTR